MLSTIAAICIGASCGALGRWLLALWLNGSSTSQATLPLGTLAANWIGAYLIGVAVAVFQQQTDLDPAWRALIVTGFLGGLTTFSSFSAEVVAMLQTERYGTALSTAMLHTGGSLMLTLAGIRTVRLLSA